MTPTQEEELTIRELVEQVDGLEGSLLVLCDAIISSSVRQVKARLEHDLLYEDFDAAGWGFDWPSWTTEHQQILGAAVTCRGCFDERTIAHLSGVEQPSTRLEELVEQGWLDACDHEVKGWSMRWSTRQLVLQHVGDVIARRAKHARYFLSRSEHGSFKAHSFMALNLERARTFGMIHDADIAARSAIALYRAMHHESPIHESITMLENVVARRSCLPGDQLAIELLMCLGESQSRALYINESIQTLELALALEPPPESLLLGDIYCVLAISLSYRGEHDSARRTATLASELYARRGDDERQTRALHALALIHVTEQDFLASIEVLEQLVERVPDHLIYWNNLGSSLTVVGRHQAAMEALEHAMSLIRDDEVSLIEPIILANVLLTYLLAHDREKATTCMIRLKHFNQSSRDTHRRYLILCSEAIYLLRHGSLLVAYHLSCEASKEQAAGFRGLALQCALACYLDEPGEALLASETLRGCSPYLHGDLDAYILFTERVLEFKELGDARDRERLQALHETLDAHDWSSRTCFLQILYMDLLERTALHLAPPVKLTITRECLCVRIGDAPQTLDLRRSPVARRLLSALIEAHLERPGKVCSVERLFESAWPGEVWNISAKTKFHTSIHRLRERVLGDLLMTWEDGYSLAYHCVIIEQ